MFFQGVILVYQIICRALQEAQDIFGVDFNFDEFEQYGDEYEEDEDEEDEEVRLSNRKARLVCRGEQIQNNAVNI